VTSLPSALGFELAEAPLKLFDLSEHSYKVALLHADVLLPHLNRHHRGVRGAFKGPLPTPRIRVLRKHFKAYVPERHKRGSFPVGCLLDIRIRIEDAVDFAACVKSRAARRIIVALRDSRRPLGITALCRMAGCSRRDALRYLSALVRLGAVVEERVGRLRLFRLQDNSVSAFMLGVVKRAGGRDE